MDSLQIGPHAAQVGLIQYCSAVKTEFTLGQYKTKTAVKRMEHMAKGSMTGLALGQLAEKSFSERSKTAMYKNTKNWDCVYRWAITR